MICSCQESTLETAAQIADIVFAGISVILALYVFIYQRNQNRFNNRLQWFKDLIIEPSKGTIYQFFDELFTTSNRLNDFNITDIVKMDVLNSVKASSYKFRRDFLVILGAVDHQLEIDCLKLIDDLLDKITQAAFDPNNNLSNEAEFEDLVVFKIYATRAELFSRIFRYDGVPTTARS